MKERGLYWLVVPHPAQCDIETPSGDGVVALDPGVRTFLTYFSNRLRQAGHHAFGRIQRLCHWLDVISRHRKRRQMRSARNAAAEPGGRAPKPAGCSRNPLPTFETHDLTQRAGRDPRMISATTVTDLQPGSAAHWCSTSTRRTPARPGWDGP